MKCATCKESYDEAFDGCPKCAATRERQMGTITRSLKWITAIMVIGGLIAFMELLT
ncbi:MAG: hypothetical protein HGA39_04065 [Coriobacteriia bacterium]|nr:hypothetical protein [Coriobacteriia bacterium]